MCLSRRRWTNFSWSIACRDRKVSLVVLQIGRNVCSPCSSPPCPALPHRLCRFVPQRAIRNTMPRRGLFRCSSASTKASRHSNAKFYRCAAASALLLTVVEPAVQASTASCWLCFFASTPPVYPAPPCSMMPPCADSQQRLRCRSYIDGRVRPARR